MKNRYLLFIAAYLLLFTASVYINGSRGPDLLMTDVSRIESRKVTKIVPANDLKSLQETVREAARQGLPISIAGASHSQGGHTFYKDAVVLSMKPFNRMVHLDEKRRILRVQSGATWADVQNYLNPYNLSVRVMQSSNIFTIGGSLSSNVHGRDLHHGPVIETVESFRLLMADGALRNVSREENEELFGLVIGGFGLFGVIVDVDLRVTDNPIYRIDTFMTDYRSFPDWFHSEILSKPEAELAIARLSVAPDSLLNEMYVTTYTRTDEKAVPALTELQEERFVERNKFLFGLSRKWDWGKNFIWTVQKKMFADAPKGELITRNNAMRPEIEFLEHRSPTDTDILQEYFVPADRFPAFVDELRTIVRQEKVNLLNATVRYIRSNDEAHLSYARHDGYAVVILINQKLSDQGQVHTEKITQQLVDAVIRNSGTYYLTYQSYPTPEQMRQVYPNTDSFFGAKRHYDPDGLFQNLFYERYAHYGR
ncbi:MULTISPECIES: FAD-binding oxidoreductase [unclassified Paenibacillus]|uniref:FAD-binding oxidoreductase n=1 Tax=unclassified Paenibacillus TaxID=185978 RepID=UPI001AE9B6D1|nr:MULTISPECIES: FAD-binding oxidoreductase [unclassified Paenibacillus]MBP1156884.1 FAD/FMN-containing dehydrogenase [Paenibacillus sp. PvP091]MBP1172377.1 FAD/FMN-containing dehydrogenase [Paenibacillus sp. PvR098]MBP2438758.1 FAD/FMN-containing dehydrogenase [Paenibacillus sp. PvP052]